MIQATLITALRQELGDQTQPYKYDDPALLAIIGSAVSDYSRFRPRQRRGSLTLQPGTLEYVLPDDYQTWTKGLDGYEILEKTLYLDTAPLSAITVPFNYLGDHDIVSVTSTHQPIIIDYCMWKFLSEVVQEGSEISELKLGKGLDIKFDNFDQVRMLADTRHNNYLAGAKKLIGGGT